MVGRGACYEEWEAAILALSEKKKSPLQERACPYPWPVTGGLGMGAVTGITACRDYTTRQKLRQERSSPSLSQTR